MTIENKRLTGILLTVAVILCVPVLAMQFTNQVIWTLPDFIVASVLLLGTSLICELILRKVKKNHYRLGIIAVILLALFLIGAELSVGIIDTPFAGN